MKNESVELQNVEKILLPLAEQHAPEGTEPQAIVDQWVHAIATDSQFYCNSVVSTPSGLKKQVIELLETKLMYTGRDAFFDLAFSGIKLKPIKKPKFKFIDLFAGIGGTRLGAQNNGGACVFTSEFDSFAQKTYAFNYGESPFGDITKIKEDLIPDHDLLLAGFPCQPFSYSGRCEGFEDKTRGTLFFDVLRILESKKPKYALLENVKGFKSHDKGNTMVVALSALDEAGYNTYWTILNSYDYGVPQYRERWYCVAIRKDIDTDDFEFPNQTDRTTKLSDIIDINNKDKSLSISDFEIERIEYHFKNQHINERVEHDSSMYEPQTKKGRHGVYSYLKSDGAIRFHVGDVAKTQIQEAFYACLDTYSPTIIANRVPKLWDIKRKLSVVEASRLQGFPCDFKFNVSNAQSYKQLGNSVTVTVIESIVDKIKQTKGFEL